MAADPNGPYAWRNRDSDNDLLRKILNWFVALGAGTRAWATTLTVNGAPVSASNPLPVDTEIAYGATYVDGSGAIVAGGVSEEVFAANPTRRYLFLINTSDTAMYVNFGTAAVVGQPSVLLVANGGFYEPLVPSGQAVNIICATIGKTFVAKQA